MKDYQTFSDKRLDGSCYSCGSSEASTRDHVPPKALLDKPFPFLAVVPSCEPCNRGFSLDEEYVVCAIEVAACGSPDPTQFVRERVARAVQRSPALATRLNEEFRAEPSLGIQPDWRRFERVFQKVSRGLLLYETSTHAADRDLHLHFTAFDDVQHTLWDQIEDSDTTLLPEVGSRQLHRMFVNPLPATTVQPGRFEFACSTALGGHRIRMAVRNTLVVDAHFE